jgi:hypothetical protein
MRSAHGRQPDEEGLDLIESWRAARIRDGCREIANRLLYGHPGTSRNRSSQRATSNSGATTEEHFTGTMAPESNSIHRFGPGTLIVRLRGTVLHFGIVVTAWLSGTCLHAQSPTVAMLLPVAFGREAENSS